MSAFIENEAEVSSDEEEIVNRRRKIASDDDDTGNEEDIPVRKRRNIDDDDEEEEEDDEEKLREEMKDLINDDDEEEEEEEEEEDAENDSDGNVAHKRRKRHDDYDDALEDEDYDLIEENLGVKVQRKKKFKRLRRIEDDEESDAEESHDSVGRQPVDDREAIANELFEGSDAEAESTHVAPTVEEDERFKDISGSEVESDPDDFIVGDDGQPITKGKRKRHLKYTDAALQEAQDIFGVDFDYNEFEQYGEEYEEDLDEEEYEEEEEEGEARPRPKKSVHKRPTKKSIFDVFEPSELERGHFTDLDNEIRSTDIPERFQLRSIPVTQADDDEVDEEAEWIYRQAFYTPTISVQNPGCQREEAHYPIAGRKPYSAVPKIRESLKFMRNNSFEVPFIAFYRKEYVEPELNINDLWTVYRWDEKWCQLIAKKRNLKRLFEKMQQFQCDEVMKDPDKPLAEGLRPLESSDIFRLREAQTQEEVRDISSHFKLYYAQDLEAMRENVHKKHIRELKEMQNGENGKEDAENETEFDAGMNRMKHPIRKNAYTVCKDAGLDGLAKKFGLTPENFGENLRDNYQRHEVDQYPIGPLELAGDYVSKRFPTAEEALKAARYMVATQISYDPVVRRCVRQTYFERAKINVKPSKQGIKEIDENHPCYTMKYLKNKPLKDLVSDQFLRLVIAEGEGLLTIEISMHPDDGGPHIYLDEIKQLYYRDEFSKNVQEWNDERYKGLEIALVRFLYPLFKKEMTLRLLTESKEGIVKLCCRKLYNWLKVAPYQIEQSIEEDEDYDTREGIRVMAIAFFPNREIPAFGALIDGTGEVTDYLRLAHILKRKNSWKDKEQADKENDLQALRRFISTKKPHVIAVGGESREALMIVDDIKTVITELMESEQMPAINVELIDNELANVYMSSKKGEVDFRDYPPLLRQAISLARRLQDPLIEFSQLCTPDEEITCLKYHPLQNHIEKEELLGALYLEFVNRTNEVGVDINQAIAHPHTCNLVQFVCGLGPRKGGALLKTLKQSHQRLESRTQLVTVCHMGPKVFINCAGFVKIDTSSLGDSTETYVEVLDGSRVHPEAYEWARKMAVDALEYDDMSEDVNPAGALEEILENPEKLKDLDLDAFAEELERQGYGNKSITLYDIRAELNHRYKDLRTPYRPPTAEETFNMLTKETPNTFYIGKLVLVQVMDIARKKPKGEQLDQANPIRNDETGLWQCPFCLKNNFPELSEVWNHFDAGNCPGQAMGVRVRLDNGVSGFVPTKLLSDKHVTNPEERVKKGMTVHGRITKIDIERFAVDVTCKSSDLKDQNSEWRPPKDLYYDYDAEDKDRQIDEEQIKKQNRQTYIKRVIVHPSFHNIGFKEAEKLLATMDQGEVIIRPSSKGADHLTVTWKVHEGINQHIDVREEGKENAFSLGQSLWINNDEFEDLDEIIARYVQPMALHARDLINFKYFHDGNGGERETMEKFLNEEKKKAPSRIHYFVSCCKEFPGTFLLSYLPRKKVRHEFIKVTPEGFRYRQQIFHSINSLFRWFKEHFRDSVVGTPGTIPSRTPLGQSSYATTPNINFANVDAQAIQRAAANIPSHVFNTLSQVAGQTPGFQGTTNNFGASYSGNNYNFQPYTPSQPIATPLVTPSYHSVNTPAPSVTTPRFPPQTPQSNWTHSVQTPQPQTPSHRGSVTPSVGSSSVGGSSTPTNISNSRSSLSTNPSAADWKRMAEQWAKKVREQDTRITRTPRTPMRGLTISPSPMIESTPAADSTPLIDEH